MRDARSHGHVTPRADGHKARCGGPTLCRECYLEWLIEHGEHHFGTLWRQATMDDVRFVLCSMATPEATVQGEPSASPAEDSRPLELPPCSCPAQPRTGELVCCRHDAAGYGVTCRKEMAP